MQELEDAIHRYLSGTLTRTELYAAVERLLQGPPAQRETLRNDLLHAPLPQAVADELLRLLDDTTEVGGSSWPEDDRTVTAPPHQASQPQTPPSATGSLLQPSSLGAGTGPEPTIGHTLKDRFVLKEVLGVGGMGTVFKALDLRKVEANDREAFVALKLLNSDFRANPLALMALQRETKRAQTLSHPNIINVYDFDRDGPNVFMTMEFLEGRPLARYIRELPEGGMRFRRVWPLIESMAEALAYAHRKGVVHSDFKPGNVFIDDEGEVKVLDFGIACAIKRREGGDDATVFNARDLGSLTPAYASLEQLGDRDPDPRDDIYALACVTYELISGKHPFGKLPADQALELNLKPKPIPGLGRRQWKGLQWALELEQGRRIPDIETFLKALRPRSSWFYAAAIATIAVAGLTATNVYLTVVTPERTPEPHRVIQLSSEQQQKITDLLELAGAHFEVGFLTTPTGSNALWAYQEVLKIDPYNEAAIKGIRKIADALEQQAWEAYEKGDRAESLKKVMEGLEADPGHLGLTKLKAKLQG
ncbi:MAG: serine/threonine protein kinase [Methylococcaceae bacterium]|nr:serine/threonine protein kinase [Methylococcaceae bacterium]